VRVLAVLEDWVVLGFWSWPNRRVAVWVCVEDGGALPFSLLSVAHRTRRTPYPNSTHSHRSPTFLRSPPQKKNNNTPGGEKEYTGKDSAQMGLDTLAQTVRDPAAMTQAMEMLKDPNVAAEVEAMMKDPAFQVRKGAKALKARGGRERRTDGRTDWRVDWGVGARVGLYVCLTFYALTCVWSDRSDTTTHPPHIRPRQNQNQHRPR
jgi:hypothetical protein